MQIGNEKPESWHTMKLYAPWPFPGHCLAGNLQGLVDEDRPAIFKAELLERTVTFHAAQEHILSGFRTSFLEQT